jgi:two-component system CheB/CheR fusion protein
MRKARRAIAAPPKASEAARQAAPQKGPDFTIVGVGASAGGLEAFSDLLRHLAPDNDIAIVFVQHLSPHHQSALVPLLADTTSLPVIEIRDGMEIRQGHIYIIPPNVSMEVIDGRLCLQPRPLDRTKYLPVDHFFRSLAAYAQNRAVGVVLSGTDSDGAAGLREIKGAGGITIAQDPKTAKFDGMPRNAIGTGAVDLVLSPELIARELAQMVRHPLLRRERTAGKSTDETAAETTDEVLADAPPLKEDQLQRIFFLLRQASGVDFTHYKQPTVHRRLHRRMVLHKISTIGKYLKFLQANPAEVNSLYQDILIHVTRFFRDAESFTALTEHAFLPILKSRATPDEPIRIWIPGCSTGEEAYSVAIALLEFLGDDANRAPMQIFATDVSESAVEQARAGVYPENISADVSAERLRRFFSRIDGNYRISKRVRDLCIFARQDLTRDPPFSRLDLIVCRNVLIYLGPLLQNKLMNVFHYALKPTGFLMLGGSETIGAHSDLFAMADKKHRLYSKKSGGIRTKMDFPSGNFAGESADSPKKDSGERGTVAGVANEANRIVQNEANRVVLTKYAPPGVVVDDEMQIIQFRGQTGPFLEPAPGDASLGLLKMAREGLVYDLRTAVHQARKSGAAVRKQGVRVRHNGHILEVNIEVVPLQIALDKRHFLVLFETEATHDVHAPAGNSGESRPKGKGIKTTRVKGLGKTTGKDGDSRVGQLRQELAASREYLQSIIQDLEAANEELQSANEEILSSNEELQSTNEELDTAKEELQSTNEELNTVNEELQARNEELSRVNSDLINLLGSVQIAIVMVTSDLRIRRLTPMAEKLLNLIPTDLGRPISDIKPNIEWPNLEEQITRVIDTVTIFEQEVRDRNGNWYTMRIRPYKNTENRIDGAVVSLFESDTAHTREKEAVDRTKDLRATLAMVHEPVAVLDEGLRVQTATHEFCELLGLTCAEIEGKNLYEVTAGRWDSEDLRLLLEQELPRHGMVEHYRIGQIGQDAGAPALAVAARATEPLAGGGRLHILVVDSSAESS